MVKYLCPIVEPIQALLFWRSDLYPLKKLLLLSSEFISFSIFVTFLGFYSLRRTYSFVEWNFISNVCCKMGLQRDMKSLNKVKENVNSS